MRLNFSEQLLRIKITSRWWCESFIADAPGKGRRPWKDLELAQWNRGGEYGPWDSSSGITWKVSRWIEFCSWLFCNVWRYLLQWRQTHSFVLRAIRCTGGSVVPL